VLGPEPALRWRLFTDQLVGVAEAVGASMAISLGALLADVPHSRPVPLIGTATDDSMIERFELQRSQYEGPTGIVGVLQDALHRHGLPTASLWAAVPGYASQIPSPKAAMALVERSCSMIGTPAPLSRLAGAASEYEVRVASLIGDDDDMVEYLHRLEQLADDDTGELTEVELDADDESFQGGALDADSLDPDALVEEVEQFLRDRTDD
jgi:predicted ATP-grasp superfamily ATP-dependent carboligase